MGLAKLMKATVILPRVETQAAVSKLAELEWFHPIQTASTSEHINPYYDDLLLKAQKLYQDIDEVVKGLGIPAETGVLVTMFKGAPKGKTNYNVDDIQGFIADLEDKSAKELAGPRKIIEERSAVQKQLEEYGNLAAVTENASGLTMDLTTLGKLSKFYASMYIIDASDEAEIRKSLGDTAVYSTGLAEKKVALTVVGAADDAERISKVMRSFGINPLQIPPNMPQNPSVAFSQATAKVKELEAKEAQLDKQVAKLKQTIIPKVLSLREAAGLAKDILETTRKPGGTRNFAIIEGYIPAEMEGKFKKLAADYVSVVEDAGVTIDLQDAGRPTMPTLLMNKGYSKNFEVVTETQGLPRYGETDPTRIISFVWPIFYGLMFADFGHGILLFGLGMLFKIRGNGRLKMWGTLIAASGLAAAVGGLGTGELFGFHFDHLPVLEGLTEALPFIGLLSVAELTFEQVIKILAVSVAVGIVHLLLAFFLRLRADWRVGNKLLVFTHDIPAIIQYLAVVALILAAIGSKYDIIGMFLSDKTYGPVPWLTFAFGDWVTVNLVAKAGPPVIIGCIIVSIIGGMKEEKHLKAHGKESPHGGMVGIIVETVMVRTIEMLANTISYSRLGIMLLVHSALLVTVNNSYEHGGGLAILIGGNIGIMMIEGLIVYIQTIRLHLYEWFPKWYKSDGIHFKKLVPPMLYTNLTWKDGDKK
ncbi:MAG: V-type ATP synthase subunit I [Nitrososphaera sp.]|uniref:V-type ATP synthase subunit I n=1 Tax=Nitrososphaera sp. TaxID=1971748 RepID=UPI003D6E2B3C